MRYSDNFLKALFSKKCLVVSYTLMFSMLANANADYKETIAQKFWGALYENGGSTYFCNKPFDTKSPLLSVSHIYSSAEIRDHLQCGTNRQCLRDSDEYQTIMSDLHNLVPANAYFEFKRKNSIFGVLDESVAANECGIRKRHHVIEPPNELKGDIARIILYMHQQYQLPMGVNYSLLNLWHLGDPPSEVERVRNDKVKAIQGTENPFIANPSLVNNIAH